MPSHSFGCWSLVWAQFIKARARDILARLISNAEKLNAEKVCFYLSCWFFVCQEKAILKTWTWELDDGLWHQHFLFLAEAKSNLLSINLSNKHYIMIRLHTAAFNRKSVFMVTFWMYPFLKVKGNGGCGWLYKHNILMECSFSLSILLKQPS